MLQAVYHSALAALLIALALVHTESAHAQAQRTFVKSTGVDNPTCSLASPCRGFTAALAATANNGEIIVLDSAGYGQVAINQSVSIIAPQGVYAGVSVFSGTNLGIGISIGGSNVKVVLKSLSINGQGGTHGITFSGSGTLHVENCTVGNLLSGGLQFTPSGSAEVYVKDSVFRNNGGVHIDIGGTSTKGSVVNTRLEASSLYGLLTQSSAVVSVRHSVASGNSSIGITATESSTLSVEDTVISNNGTGILSEATAKVAVSRNTVTGNGTGLFQFGTSIFESLGNNNVRNNTNNTSGIITTIGGL